MKTKPLLPPPDLYEGAASAFIDRYVAPNFPPADQIVCWTDALLTYFTKRQDPVCVVRGPRRGVLRAESDVRVVDSDNAPAIWSFLRCRDGAVHPTQLSQVLEAGALPILMALSKEQRAHWSYGTAMPQGDKTALWRIQLKLCHIFPARRGHRRFSARQLALRNLCPANHFLFPSPRAFVMQRLDRGESEVSDLGESDFVIGWVLNRLAEHLGSRADVLTRFAEAVGGQLPPARNPDWLIRLRRRPPAQIVASPFVDKDSAGMLQASLGMTLKRWTLNAAHGYYLATGLKQQVVDVALSYKSPAGVTTNVGRFHLDLRPLASQGVVRKRVTEAGDVFDVKIVRDPDGSYWLSVSRAARYRLK